MMESNKNFVRLENLVIWMSAFLSFLFQFFAIKTLIMWLYDQIGSQCDNKIHGNRISKGFVFLVTSAIIDPTTFVRKAKNIKWRGQISYR